MRVVFIVYSLMETAFDSKLHELKRINENASEMRERGERGTEIVWKQPKNLHFPLLLLSWNEVYADKP